MASRTLRRILSTGLRTGSGVLGAQIQAAQDEEERRRQENIDNLNALLGRSLVEERRARTKNLLETPEPSMDKMKARAVQKALAEGDMDTYEQLMGIAPKPPNIRVSTKTPGGTVSGPYGEDMSDVIASMGGVAPEKRTNTTGIGDFTDVIGQRTKENKVAREEAKQKIIDSFPTIFYVLDKDDNPTRTLKTGVASYSPEELINYLKEQVPAQMTELQGWWPFRKEVQVDNPAYGEMNQTLGGINVPEPYKPPVGPGATALADSVAQAQTRPDIAAALLGGVSEPSTTIDHVPSVDEFVTMLKQQVAAGNEIDWDQVKADFPNIDIENLKRRVNSEIPVSTTIMKSFRSSQ